MATILDTGTPSNLRLPAAEDPRSLAEGTLFLSTKNLTRARVYRVNAFGVSCEDIETGVIFDYATQEQFGAIVISLPDSAVGAEQGVWAKLKNGDRIVVTAHYGAVDRRPTGLLGFGTVMVVCKTIASVSLDSGSDIGIDAGDQWIVLRDKTATDPDSVDPRTLPAGALFKWHRRSLSTWRIVFPGLTYRSPDSEEKTYSFKANGDDSEAILVSLPELAQEVELRSLAPETWFVFGPSEATARKRRPGPFMVCHQESVSQSQPFVELYRTQFKCIERNGTAVPFNADRRVIRVPAPSSSVSGNAVEPAESSSVVRKRPETEGSRWPNTPSEHHARLDAQLAQQVASGGQDCKSARSLIERADRLRREAAERESARRGYMRERVQAYETVQLVSSHGVGEDFDAGIDGLKLERPLISWKRRK